MLNSFEIRNFRLFRHLQVKKLSRVNLIVGKNNSGKSTFLEALELYASNASPMTLLDIVESRQENWLSEARPHPKNFLDNPIRHLFFGHRLPRIGEEGILLGEIDSGISIHLNVAAYQIKSDDEGTSRTIRIHDTHLDEDLSNIQVVLVAEEDEKTRRLFRLDRDFRDIKHSSMFFNQQQNPEFKYTWQFVSTDNMPNRKLAVLWDLTNLFESLKSEVITALSLIDSRVSGVGFVDDISKGSGSNNRIPLITLKGIDEPLPLKSMGDGMNRLFHLIVALVNSQNGLLLIDEFENGLHWSVQPKVWDIIFQLSERLNVQVFATTHSRDCIEGFDSAWKHYPSLGAFLRLEAKDDNIKVTEYTSETLSDAIDMDVEVR
jgi:energy-coupling factor transporter ATP-binding protein EcfA2